VFSRCRARERFGRAIWTGIDEACVSSTSFAPASNAASALAGDMMPPDPTTGNALPCRFATRSMAIECACRSNQSISPFDRSGERIPAVATQPFNRRPLRRQRLCPARAGSILDLAYEQGPLGCRANAASVRHSQACGRQREKCGAAVRFGDGALNRRRAMQCP
jgi:hypothetical protein